MLELILALLQRIYCKEKFFSNSSINFFIFYLLGYFIFANSKARNDFCQNLRHNGSWWNGWHKWLQDRSGKLENSIDYDKLEFIEIAPGRYVRK